ncbi:MAG: MOSC N-terminal beta barrel domain-containing protein [Pseudomonadota bacterium]
MNAHLAGLWRHPIKGIGAEAIERVALTAGAPMPWDRRFALAHGRSRYDSAAPAWQRRANFVVQAHVAELMRVEASLDEAAGTVTLTHPTAEPLTADPASAAGAEALAAWIEPLGGLYQPGPWRVAHVPGQAMTDMEPPYLSILSRASLRALSQHAGIALGERRFRGNLWLDGLDAWAEEEWIGREITIGAVRLRVDEPVGRCKATTAGPRGTYDHPTLDTLRAARGHTEFGVYATVIEGGEIALGDAVTTAAA